MYLLDSLPPCKRCGGELPKARFDRTTIDIGSIRRALKELGYKEVVRCPRCAQKLRVSTNKGKGMVHCPNRVALSAIARGSASGSGEVAATAILCWVADKTQTSSTQPLASTQSGRSDSVLLSTPTTVWHAETGPGKASTNRSRRIRTRASCARECLADCEVLGRGRRQSLGQVLDENLWGPRGSGGPSAPRFGVHRQFVPAV